MWQMGFQRKMLEDRTRTFGEAHVKTEEPSYSETENFEVKEEKPDITRLNSERLDVLNNSYL